MKKYIPLVFAILISLYPLIKPVGEVQIYSNQVFQSPSIIHIGGTDSLGRDLFHRCFNGAGISLWICFISLILTYGLGLTIGSLLSYWRRSNHLVIFMIDVFDSIPNFLLVALFSILLNRGLSISESFATAFTVLVVSIALSAWPPIARNVRLEILQLKGKDFLNASITAGASPLHIIRVHYFRAIWPWLRVSIIHNIPQFLLIESVLSFTGFGLGSHQATLGYLIYEGWKNALLYPHLFILPSLILCALVFILTSRIREPV